jgi:hypothetical protein
LLNNRDVKGPFPVFDFVDPSALTIPIPEGNKHVNFPERARVHIQQPGVTSDGGIHRKVFLKQAHQFLGGISTLGHGLNHPNTWQEITGSQP